MPIECYVTMTPRRHLRHDRRLAPRLGDRASVVVGAALEHAPLDASVGRLARLLRPGGVFLNLGVRPGPTATVLSRIYRFRPYTTGEVLQSLRRFGLEDGRVVRLTATEFPVNLTRIAVIARKS